MSRFSVASLSQRDEPLLPSQEDASKKASPGVVQLVKDAVTIDWLPAYFYRQYQQGNVAADPNWQGVYANDSVRDDLLSGLDEEYQSYLAGSVSLEHALTLRDQALKLQASRDRLAQAGWGGVALRVGANLLDPAQIAFGVATGGAGWLGKGGRLARIAEAGLVNFGQATAIESYIATQDPGVDATDVFLAAGSAAVLGGALQAAIGTKWTKAYNRLTNDAQYKEVAEALPEVVAMGGGKPNAYATQTPGSTVTHRGRTAEVMTTADEGVVQIKYEDGERGFADVSSLKLVKERPPLTPSRPVDVSSRESVLNHIAKSYGSVDDNFFFHGTTGTDTAASIDFEGLATGGITRKLDDTFEYADYEDGYIMVFDRNAMPGKLKDSVYEPHLAVGEGNFRDAVESGQTPETAIRYLSDPIKPVHAFTIQEVKEAIDRVKATNPLTPAGERRFSDAISPEVTQGIAEARLSQTSLADDSPVLADALRRDPAGSVRRFDDLADNGDPIPGAERLAPEVRDTGGGDGAVGGGTDGVGGETPPPAKIATDLHFHNLSDAKSSMGKLRGDMAGLVGMDESSPLLRTAGNAALQDPLLKRLDNGQYAAANDSMAAWTSRTSSGKKAEFLPNFDGLRAKWKLQQRGGGDLDKAFNEAVGVAVSQSGDPAALTKFAPEVREAAKLVADAHAWGLNLMKRHGLKWALDVEEKDNYLHRVWKQPAINRLVSDVGEDEAGRFFTEAIMVSNPDIERPLALKMGKGMLRTLLDLDVANDIEKARILGGDPDAIRKLLHRDASGLTADEIDQLVMRLKPKSDGGAPSILKRRTVLDENYFEALTDKKGNHYPIGMADLLERDAEKLTANYIEQATRLSAERAALDAIGAKFGKKFANYDALASAIREEMKSAGVPDTRINNQLGRLETGWRLVRGLPVGDRFGPEGAQMLRVIRDINYITKSGGFGIVQAVEMGNTLAEAGLSASMNAIPALGRVIRNAITGRVDDEIANFAETVMGAGVDPITRRAYSMIDDGQLLTGTESRIGKFREKVTEPLSRFSNKINFLNAIDSRVRKWTVSAVLNRLASEAKNRTLSAKRLLDLGIADAEADQFFKEVSAAVTDRPGAWGGRQVTGIDLRKMSPEMGSKLVFAIDRWGSRLIQRNDVGNMSKWMHDDLAKMLLQFRNFAITAWPKQFLQKIQMADKPAALAAFMTSAMGAMVYAAMQATYSLGRKDAEEFRKERLSLKNIAAAGFSRAGWSSILPGAADNLNSALHVFDEPLFKYGRASGLSTSGILQNPTTATFDAAMRTARNASTALQSAVGIRDWHPTQSQARSAAQLIPFQNVIGMKNLIDYYTSRLPEN